jgi:uncharacterized protein (TIGR02246 family)
MPSITEDRDEILQLMYRYNHLIDSGDAAGWAETFTEDGVFDVAGQVRSGHSELTAFAAEQAGHRHVVVNPVIDVTGDSATVRAYFVVYAGGALRGTGTYADELVRTPDGWRFAKRVSTPDPRDGSDLGRQVTTAVMGKIQAASRRLDTRRNTP